MKVKRVDNIHLIFAYKLEEISIDKIASRSMALEVAYKVHQNKKLFDYGIKRLEMLEQMKI
jgi:hypothetical protein